MEEIQQRIVNLERSLQEEETRIQDLFKSGKVPTREEYEQLDRIKKDLRVERGIATKKAKRETPYLDRRVTVKMPSADYDKLLKRAGSEGMKVSEYLRVIIGKHVDSL